MKAKYNFFKNTSFAISGLKYALAEGAFKLELSVSVVALVISFCLDISAFERGLLIASLLMVLSAECFNTAIEKAIDLCTQKYHPLAKAAKDLGSAGVMLSILAALCIWLGVLIKAVI